MDCSLPGSSVHGISQVKILERVVISFFRGSSWPKNPVSPAVTWEARGSNAWLYFIYSWTLYLKNNFYLFIFAVLGLCCRAGFSLAAASGDHSLAAVRWLLPVVLLLWSLGSVAAAPGHSCSEASEIFPDQGLNLCLLHWQVGSLPLSHQESPWTLNLTYKTHIVLMLTISQKLKIGIK